MGVMSKGRLLQVATPRELYDHPADGFVADFVGSLNVFDGRVAEIRAGVATVFPEAIAAPDGGPTPRLVVGADGLAVGDAVRVAVRPERVWIAAVDGATAATDGALLAGVVSAGNYLGAVTQIVVAVPGGPPVLIQKTSDGRLAGIAEGAPVHIGWAPDAAFVLPRDRASVE